MLHFVIGLSIGLLIVSPVIALVLFAGLESRKPKAPLDQALRKPADILPFDMARTRAKMPAKRGLTA